MELRSGIAAQGGGTHVKRFRGGLVFKAHRLLYHSTLGLRVIKRGRERRRTSRRALRSSATGMRRLSPVPFAAESSPSSRSSFGLSHHQNSTFNPERCTLKHRCRVNSAQVRQSRPVNSAHVRQCRRFYVVASLSPFPFAAEPPPNSRSSFGLSHHQRLTFTPE